METIFKSVKYCVHDFWEIYGDHRLDHLPLIRSGPWHVISLTSLYLFFVLVIGPKFMKNRKPFELRTVMLIHNIFLVLVNAACLIVALWGTNFGAITLKCEPFDPSSPLMVNQILLAVGYIYYITKFIDFLDTIYFVLRKKQNQITGLHLFHHSMMPFACYIYFKFSSYTNNGFIPMVNAFVHTIMYSYYALSSLGPSTAGILWWKKHITQLQLLQFVLIMIHSSYMFLNSSCTCPKVLILFQLIHAILFFNLFLSFYKRAYPSKLIKRE